jgi:methylenetetrahydrofolate dehydrogenase (NADP+) / methenyltetrahydrofolate cyclohydrolase
MSAQVINGKELVQSVREHFRLEVEELAKSQVQPGLAVVLVGNDPASAVYVRNKAKACETAGIYSEVHRLPEDAGEEELLALVERLNGDKKINGILVQLPLPRHINEDKVIDAIHPDKDVDCFHPINVGNLMIGKPGFLPCTPVGVIEVLKRMNVEIAGKHAVVVGRSNIVGKPMAMLLLREHATVTVCHSRTPDMEKITAQADILVAAVGRPQMIKAKHLKPGAIVIDVGINRLPDGKLVGDVDFEDVLETAGMITPVPGCVGPMTITMLLANTIVSARRAAGLE